MDIEAVLTGLGEKRPVFHSEFDFQFALAGQISSMHPNSKVRLEVPMSNNESVDLVVTLTEPSDSIAIELKYPTRKWSGTVGDEHFSLRNHSARDLRRYDIVKDIRRVEQFVAHRPGWAGCVIVVTNDSGYWSSPGDRQPSNDHAFRVHDGLVLGAGPRKWVALTASTAGRQDDIQLAGQYEIRWADYSHLDESAGGTLRSLVIPIPSVAGHTGARH